MDAMILESKRFVSLALATRDFPLSFESRAVWSHLRWCPTGITRDRLKDIDKSIRVPSSVDDLVSVGLAECKGLKVYPVEPDKSRRDWFRWHNGGKTWAHRINFLAVYLPSQEAPITLRQSVVYATIRSLADSTGLDLGQQDRGQTLRGLENLTRIDHKTIGSALQVLDSLGLVSTHPIAEGSDYFAAQITGDPDPDWFRGKEDNKPVADRDQFRRLFAEKKADKIALREYHNSGIIAHEVAYKEKDKDHDIRPDSVEHEDSGRGGRGSGSGDYTEAQRATVARQAVLCGFDETMGQMFGVKLGDLDFPAFNELTERLTPGDVSGFKRWFASWQQMTSSEQH